MKITLLSDERIRLDGGGGPLSVEAESAEMQYSPFHMLASALASCTYSVLASWGTHAKLGVDDLGIEVEWGFEENPHRLSTLQLHVDWPSLPAERRSAALRAAGLCTVKKAFETPPQVQVAVSSAPQPAGSAA